jgi:hypothetical protein
MAAMFEVRRDIDLGPRTLKRGAKISEDEVDRLAPGKFGALRRTGIIRPVGVSDREAVADLREARRGRLAQSNQAGVKALRAGGSDE